MQAFGSIGFLLAIFLSYIVNHSILWCILHAILGWMYVVYWLIVYSNLSNYINEFLMRQHV